MPADLPHRAMCSLLLSTRSLFKHCFLHSRNLGLVEAPMLKFTISMSHCWYVCLFAHVNSRRKLPYTRRYRNIMNQFSVEAIIDILVIVFDTLVFVLTIFKTWQLYKQCKAISKDWRTSLTAVLLHDGLFDSFSCISL